MCSTCPAGPQSIMVTPGDFTCTLLALLRNCPKINGAGEGNRTLVSGLGSPRSTIEPHPQKAGIWLPLRRVGRKLFSRNACGRRPGLAAAILAWHQAAFRRLGCGSKEMPPRWGSGSLEPWFYRDGAPLALGGVGFLREAFRLNGDNAGLVRPQITSVRWPGAGIEAWWRRA